jgi:hypothetical protein
VAVSPVVYSAALADRSDHEPPHPERTELTTDGSAATYSVTAPTGTASNGLPLSLTWPQPTTAGAAATMLLITAPPPYDALPEHALLPSYRPPVPFAAGPHGAPTSRLRTRSA